MLKRSRLLFASLLVLGAVPVSVSCNAITGVESLSLQDDGDGGGGPAISSGSLLATVGSGAGPAPDKTVEAGGVAITSIKLYQGVERPLMVDGAAATSDIPVVASRDALIRVFVSPDETYNGAPVIGRLYIGGAKIEDTRVLSGASVDGTLDSTINFEVPGKQLIAGASFRVELKQNPGASAPTGTTRYPAGGMAPLDPQSDGATLKIVLVPIRYEADGSNREPDTTPEQVQVYKDHFFGFYPAPAVEITVHEPMPWQSTVDAFGSGWDTLLSAVGDLRQQDGVASDVYYYGIFAPAESEGQFCSGGCVLGLANLAGPSDPFLRAGIGLGYKGTTSADTAVHEIGHTHGRQHSPCGGAQGTDPSYPHPMAAIGVWGYDLAHKKLMDPAQAKDVMGYCTPMWTSDYTFKAFFERLKTVNTAKINIPIEMQDRTYNRARVGMNGVLTWMEPVTLETPPVGFETKTVTVQTEGGTQTIVGEWYPYDHIPGGVIVWPATESPASVIKLNVDGKLHTLQR